MSTLHPGPQLLGRRSERAALDELLASVRAGPSRALVLRGEAGVGKSALLGYVVERASGCGIARAAGVESEMELAFARTDPPRTRWVTTWIRGGSPLARPTTPSHPR